jgi:4'-phosphopantetheinyl transferase
MSVAIEDNQVHVWQVNLKTVRGTASEFTGTLSPDELERADKFKFPRDREHFILSHSQLRLILSKYCDCLPGEFSFRYNSCRKPSISNPEFEKLKFNMSHSNDLMLVGLCNHNDIGIDVEKVREVDELENIADENFSAQEIKYIKDASDKTNTFFKIWTRKEAFIKAIGKGIHFPLKSFCVELKSPGSLEHLVILHHPSWRDQWRTSELIISDGYTASLAINSDRFKISYFQL